MSEENKKPKKKEKAPETKYVVRTTSPAGIAALCLVLLALFGMGGYLATRPGGFLAELTNQSKASDNVDTTVAKTAVDYNVNGGVIGDIDWENIIGYDSDGNPIYGAYGLVDGVWGYDISGAPIMYGEPKASITGTAADGTSLYGNYSAIQEARSRGINDGSNTDINWNTIVAYDSDGNPIFGSISNRNDIVGYDISGNPIYKTDVVTMVSNNGDTVYDYSSIIAGKIGGNITNVNEEQTREIIREELLKQMETTTRIMQASVHDGANGQDGIDGVDGRDGIDGADGHDGTNGEDGEDGQDGRDGQDGKDGTNGANGADGAAGKDGYTPVSGKDYMTDADIESIAQSVTTNITNNQYIENALGQKITKEGNTLVIWPN